MATRRHGRLLPIPLNVLVSAAYNQWTQFEDFPRFMDGADRIEQRTDTLTRCKAKIGDAERRLDEEITEQIPDERVARLRARR
ncbi:Polyketide cyclase / dehydrase and lipid transport [Streptomyces mirabilis]|uniref:Polyketide cyclase / dehydrase and lipid transport n=1 Tax=Streptomyces mirabilis TaxID=68239 RepID=A0A1I2VXA7_9ACTN|nr:Polyketide cyclase / dehydrase and lipid transport [Streptomyces mirabilis]